jgi:hypothetical protein
MAQVNDFDFGFTAVSEDELKKLEKELQNQVEASSRVVTRTMQDKNDAIKQLRNMIVPLLNNLMKDEGKDYIFWPDRSTKIKSFLSKIDEFVEQSTKD